MYDALLQPPVPYSAHLGWELSREAYFEDGPSSWDHGRMPHQITGNAAFAAQMAQLLAESLGPETDGTITVLELGGGSGAFAHAFIAQFAQCCSLPLRYLFSDMAAANLLALQANPHFQALIQSGALELVQADLAEPGVLTTLEGQTRQMPQVDLLLMNYLLCHQPFELVRRGPDGFEQGLIATYAPIDTDPDDSTGPAEQMRFSYQSRPSELEFEADPRLRQWLTTQLQALPGRWQMYPGQSLKALSQWFEYLAPNGLLLISDKGWADDDYTTGLPEPSRHGRHLEWPVHFPLLRRWCQAQGLTAMHTDHPLWMMHTLMAVKGPLPSDLSTLFEQKLNRSNLNLYAAELIDSAEACQEEDPRKAAMLYLQALEHRPGDPRVTHELIACLIAIQAFGEAEKYLNLLPLDLFDSYDFGFQRGQVALFRDRPQQAVTAFEDSLSSFGPDPATYYNLGLSQMLLHRHAEARTSFTRALELDPEHDLAQAALESWDEAMGEEADG